MLRVVPSREVARWIVAPPAHELYITAVTEAEIRVVVNMMPTGKRKTQLHATVDQTLGQVFAGRMASLVAFTSTQPNASRA